MVNEDIMTHSSISLSDNAGKRIAQIVDQKDDGTLLRISVVGGGCSGFQYTFDLTDKVQQEDLILENHGGKVAIDPVSVMYMDGSQIDFVDNLMGQSFQINNPNAVASCGCGTSFTV